MHAVGYAGIAFMETGRAALLLENGDWLTMTAAQGDRLVRHRAEEGLRPIPIVDPPTVLQVCDPFRKGSGPQSHTRVELPPSVITRPLVLWAGRGSESLTCEGVIPYPNGFEIELRVAGLLVEDAEMPCGRSSRGFSHLRGLQLTVTFADGRSRRIADLTSDLTSGDEESPVTVSPFLRASPDPETLWLWTMPAPTDGHVRLVATWALRGIEQAVVELDLAGSNSGQVPP